MEPRIMKFTTNTPNKENLLTPEELEYVRLIVSNFELQVRKEAAQRGYNNFPPAMKKEVREELGRLQDILRKIKLMKGTK
jgi:hypothetical protein